MQLYSTKFRNKKQSLVNSALTLGVSSSNTLKQENFTKDKGLQDQTEDIKIGVLTDESNTPMANYISQTNLPVNSPKTNFLRYFPDATKKLRKRYGLTARWIVDFIDRLDHCQTIFGGSWSYTNKQWADLLGCSVRTFKTILKITEKELKLVIVNRTSYKRRDDVYIKQYRYCLNPEGLEDLKDIWFSRLKSIELKMNNTPIPSAPTGKCKKRTNIIVNHKGKNLGKFNKENEANLFDNLKEKKEFKAENFIPDGIYYDLAEKKIGKYNSMITEARNFANYCVNSERFKDKTFTQYEMNGLFVNWWLECRSSYLYEHNPLRLIPYAKRVKYNQNLKAKKESIMPKERTIKVKDEKITNCNQLKPEAIDYYAQNENCRVSTPDEDLTPEQHAEYDRQIEEMLKKLRIRA